MNPPIAVSVIVPVYNVENYLGEAIESVLKQTLQQFEIILVNDGSTDSSLEICKKHLTLDKRIKLIDQENSGVSIARNKGLEISSGEYVFFMDSDDTLHEQFLSTSYKVANQSKIDLVIVGDYFCRRGISSPAFPTWALFLSAQFLKKNAEIKFPPNIQPSEDGLFSHQLLALTSRVGLNPDGVYYYRNHELQNHKTMLNNTQKLLSQIPNWFAILKDFYEKNQLLKSHCLHLALFLEHEPFELRYLSYNLTEEEKQHLHKLVVDFYENFVAAEITEAQKRMLGKPFKLFVQSTHPLDFDKGYKWLIKEKKIKLRLLISFL